MRDKKTSYIILALLLALFIIGISTGSIQTVLDKAVNICLECIGIG